MTDSHSAAPDIKRFSQLYPTPTVNPISNCTLNHEIHSQERKIIHSDAMQRCYGDNLPPLTLLQPSFTPMDPAQQKQAGTIKAEVSVLGAKERGDTFGKVKEEK